MFDNTFSSHEFLAVFTRAQILITTITNFLLIYTTLFHVKQIVGTYKYMIIIFAFLGIAFSINDQVAKPLVHSYSEALLVFSYGEGWFDESVNVRLTALIIYAGIHTAVLALAAMQFVYRYLALVHPGLTKLFQGFGIILWVSYPIVFGAANSCSFYLLTSPDEYSDNFLRNEIFSRYNVEITNTARLAMIPFDINGNLRINNALYLLVASLFISIQYWIIIYSGVQMHLQMNKELLKFSVPNQKLQKQFFKALIVQITVPAILFVLPCMPFLIAPFFTIQVWLNPALICSLFSIYPPIDSIAFMLIVSEYRTIIRQKLMKCCSKDQLKSAVQIVI